MIHVNGKSVSNKESDFNAFTSVSEDKIKESIVIRGKRTVVCNIWNIYCRVNGNVMMVQFHIAGSFQKYMFANNLIRRILLKQKGYFSIN